MIGHNLNKLEHVTTETCLPFAVTMHIRTQPSIVVKLVLQNMVVCFRPFCSIMYVAGNRHCIVVDSIKLLVASIFFDLWLCLTLWTLFFQNVVFFSQQ